jgi:hypothetical protein
MDELKSEAVKREGGDIFFFINTWPFSKLPAEAQLANFVQ